ncbi:glutamate 5-kinase [Alicyclobacillus cellulosilyticus]|uniref:Glutamate 5-kinase n=1 Tax=Alicyclobacillus cellulosilyticus TaxID=1003997 RepID=A0A917K4V1_9BACL|nr:glutamate 5-kinase [Alicyclobacillus cellulosilyticus]GGI97968.1 glutamate 5-kinase [Alicyclobacillus cellulosilyticus]
MKVRRAVIKVGSSSLTSPDGGLCARKVSRLTEQMVRLRFEHGWQVVLVSSGAVAAGTERLGWQRASITLPEKQAAAAVGQGLLMAEYERRFAEHGLLIAQLLLTRADIADRKRFLHIRNTMETLLQHGVIPVVNENDTVAVEEIRFGDNDTLASLVALVAEAQLLVLLTDIDGLYTADPRRDPSARRITDVWELTPEMERAAGGRGSKVGTGGMRTKLAAARIAMESGIDTVVASSEAEDVLLRIAAGEPVGTWFHARPHPVRGKKSWVAYGSRASGRILVDAGAVEALCNRSVSLLLPGVTGVIGTFQEGAVVEIAGPDGRVFGKGVVNFSDRDLRMLLERRARGEVLTHLQEVVHRNDLVILVSRSAEPS